MEEHRYIHNAEMTKEFFETITPQLERDEVMLLMGQARRKYVEDDEKTFKHDPIIMKQVIRENDSEYFLWKLRQLCGKSEWAMDSHKNKIPDKAMAIYYDFNPKSTIAAYAKFSSQYNHALLELNNALENRYRTFKNDILHDTLNLDKSDNVSYHKIKKPAADLLSCLHKSNSRKVIIMIDVDTKNKDVVSQVQTMLADNTDLKWVTETRGGYHFLLDKTKETGRFIYLNFADEFEEEIEHGLIELKAKTMTVVPGTIQGGFKVVGKKWEL